MPNPAPAASSPLATACLHRDTPPHLPTDTLASGTRGPPDPPATPAALVVPAPIIPAPAAPPNPTTSSASPTIPAPLIQLLYAVPCTAAPPLASAVTLPSAACVSATLPPAANAIEAPPPATCITVAPPPPHTLTEPPIPPPLPTAAAVPAAAPLMAVAVIVPGTPHGQVANPLPAPPVPRASAGTVLVVPGVSSAPVVTVSCRYPDTPRPAVPATPAVAELISDPTMAQKHTADPVPASIPAHFPDPSTAPHAMDNRGPPPSNPSHAGATPFPQAAVASASPAQSSNAAVSAVPPAAPAQLTCFQQLHGAIQPVHSAPLTMPPLQHAPAASPPPALPPSTPGSSPTDVLPSSLCPVPVAAMAPDAAMPSLPRLPASALLNTAPPPPPTLPSLQPTVATSCYVNPVTQRTHAPLLQLQHHLYPSALTHPTTTRLPASAAHIAYPSAILPTPPTAFTAALTQPPASLLLPPPGIYTAPQQLHSTAPSKYSSVSLPMLDPTVPATATSLNDPYTARGPVLSTSPVVVPPRPAAEPNSTNSRPQLLEHPATLLPSTILAPNGTTLYYSSSAQPSTQNVQQKGGEWNMTAALTNTGQTENYFALANDTPTQKISKK